MHLVAGITDLADLLQRSYVVLASVSKDASSVMEEAYAFIRPTWCHCPLSLDITNLLRET